jgi:hypothetical protein
MDELAVIQTFRPAPPPDAYAAARARRALRTTIHASRRGWMTRPRILVAAAVFAVAGATAAAASGLADRVREFVAGGPAPAPVQRQFELQSRRKVVVPWLEQNPRYHAIASKAEGVLAIETSVGPVYLWVAPTVGGGDCQLLDIQALPLRESGAGGCSPQPVRYDYVPRSGISETRVGNRYLRLLHGRVAPDVAVVEVRFTNDEKATIPTAKGFFLRELTGDQEPELLIARDADGHELGRHTHRRLRMARSYVVKPTGPYRTVIEIDTSWGYPLTLAVAPGANGSVCTETRYRGLRTGSCRLRRVDDDAISVGIGLLNEPPDGKPLVKLEGSVGSSIERLELEYRDGGRVEVPIVEGYVLFELSRDRAPKQLVGFGADGSVVARRALR